MSCLASSSERVLPLVDHAQGVYLYDDAGKDYLDGSSGAMTVSIGHGVPEVLEAMNKQMQKVCFAYRTQFRNAPVEQLGRELTEVAPGDINRVFFVNGGSEATELSIRTAIQYWKSRGKSSKTKVLGRQLSYHGMTMGSLSMSGHVARRADYSDLLHQFSVAPPPYPYRYDVPDDGKGGASVWENVIQEQGADTIAAIIVEPVVGAAAGALTPPIGYLRALREICDKNDILLVSDEVITGLGRTGKWFACMHDDVVPDMIATGKGMSSGYAPMGSLLIRDKLIDSIDDSHLKLFGHTFSANPLGASACLAVVRYMKNTSILDNVAVRSHELEAGLKALASKHPWMADVRGRGLLWGFEFIKDPSTKEPIEGSNYRFVELCSDAGLIVYGAGFSPLSNAVLICPPLVISQDEVKELLARLETALQAFAREYNLSL